MPEWQPIDRAPLEIDVRVQAQDPLGTYVLSFLASFCRKMHGFEERQISCADKLGTS